MCLLPYTLSIIGLALLIFGIVLYLDVAERARRRSWAARDLSRLNMELTGDPLASFSLRGRHGGMDLVLEASASAPLPGPSGQERTVCLMKFEANMSDFVLCKRSDQDAVMGAFPAIPELRTGHSAFDQSYAVFSRAEETDATAGFRTAPARAPRWCVPTPVLEQLIELGVEWARVQQGRAELAIRPVHSGAAARGLAMARSLAGAATEHVAPLPPEGAARAPTGVSPVISLLVGGTWAFFSFLIGLFALSPTAIMRSVCSREICGADGPLVVSGDSYRCTYAMGLPTDLYPVSCGLFVTAVVLLGSSLFAALLLTPKERNPN